ncbi:MAG: prepilin-type N-terminal cleavage/methylation domain-containing protein [Epsilonproteobacteria bacterium]|nr:prepilin-type N-terminal cleavage/methylation domain-containing protein [Campylobacterota bacterium]
MTIKGRWGFTLIELIIVIIIISTMSFMVFSENMGGGVKDRERVSPLNLRQSIRKLANGEQITLFCIDRCRSCYIMRGRGDIQKFEVDINFGMDFKVYTLDRGGELTPIEDFGRVEDRKVCFRYTLYRNGSGSKYVLSNSEGLYYLPSYFGKAQMVDDMDSAKKLWLREEFDLKDGGNYY